VCSTRKLGLNLEKAVKQSKFTPPSLVKATPSESASNYDIVSNWKIASNQDNTHPVTLSNPAILCNSTILSNLAMPSDPATIGNPSTFGDADDVMLPSPSKSEDVHVNNGTSTAFNPTEGRTTAVIAVMRGNPKDRHTRQRSNKHCKQKIVWVLLDSGSDGNLIFENKDKPMLLPYSKRLVPQSWNTSNGIFQMWRKARVELNFFEYSDSKRYRVEPDVVEYNKDNKPQYDLILGDHERVRYHLKL
jgi:hypothetical protein